MRQTEIHAFYALDASMPEPWFKRVKWPFESLRQRRRLVDLDIMNEPACLALDTQVCSYDGHTSYSCHSRRSSLLRAGP